MKVQNNEGYLFSANLEGITRGYKPREFSKHNPYTLLNINTYIKINNIRVNLISDKYMGYDSRMQWECECGEKYSCSLHHFIGASQHKCTVCTSEIKSEKLRLPIKEVNDRITEHGYTPLFNTYTNSDESLPCLDPNGYKVMINIKRLKAGYGAYIFHKSNPYTIENIAKYLILNSIDSKIVSDVYVDNKTPLVFLCPCGDTYSTSWDSFTGNKVYRCQKCSKNKSSYEVKVEDWLEANNIIFVYQYSISDCRNIYPLPFDFYIPCFNVIIEVHGIQHYQPIELWGGIDTFKEQQKRDKIKEDYCKMNNIKLLVISYKEFENDNYLNILEKQFLRENC